MKTILSIVLICFLMPAQSQNLRLNVYTGYVCDDKVDSYYDPTNYYNGKIKGGFQWGIGAEYMPSNNFGVELSYFGQFTKAPMTYYKPGIGPGTGYKNTDFDLNLNWILLGGNRYFKKPGGKVEGFGGLMAGMVLVNLKNPDNGNKSNTTKFAWGIKGGANIWVTPKVGIKLQAQLMSAVQAAGGGLYFGTGGVGTGVSTYSTMYQLGFNAGAVFAFGGAGAAAGKK